MKTEKKLGMDSAEGVQREPKNENTNEVAGTVSPLESAGQAKDTAILPSMTLDQMLDNLVWIGNGSAIGFINNPGIIWTFKKLLEYTDTESFEMIDHKRVANAVLWKKSPKRKNVFSCDFMPGADPVFFNEDGNPMLNTWRAIKRWPPKVSVQPFLDQIEYLFPGEAMRETLLDFLAHTEQKPGVLPTYGWLHIAINQGTGRNWMSDSLKKVWRGYSANVDLSNLMDSQFNSELAGKVLLVVDEVQEGAGENRYKHANKLKDLITAKTRSINKKFMEPYEEHNAGRWLVFSNHNNALPLEDTDRRWAVVIHKAEPRSKDYYKKLYAWSDNPESANAIGWYLSKRDISGFNPGIVPDMGEDKRAALDASKSMIRLNAEVLVEHWPADIITNENIAEYLSDDSENKKFLPAMRHVLEELRCVRMKNPLRIGDKTLKCWFIRNSEVWLKGTFSQWREEVTKIRVDSEYTVHRIIADKVENPPFY